MANQGDLFDPKTLARRDDPETSHAAAMELHMSGKLGLRMAYALDRLRRDPGSTASELDMHGRGSLIAKRLNDLRKAGLARVEGSRTCRVTGKRAQLWWPA